jgi:hypothetical protein
MPTGKGGKAKKGAAKEVTFALPPQDDPNDKAAGGGDDDGDEETETNHAIVNNLVSMGLMTFPNVEEEKKRLGDEFDLDKMRDKDRLLRWKCPCGAAESEQKGSASKIRKAIILHLLGGKGKDGGDAHKEILAKAAPIRTKLGSQASHRRIAEIFHGKSGVRFFGQVPPPRRLTHPHHTPAPRPHPYTPTSRSQLQAAGVEPSKEVMATLGYLWV